MDILENGAYHARLLMYKGLRTPESVLNLNTADDIQIATQGYGVGNWHLVNGDKAKAKEILRSGRRRKGVAGIRVHRGRGRLEARSSSGLAPHNDDEIELWRTENKSSLRVPAASAFLLCFASTR